MSNVQSNPSTPEPRVLQDVDDAANAILAGWEEPQDEHSEPTEEAADTQREDETSQGDLFDEEAEAEEVDVDEDEDFDDADDDDDSEYEEDTEEEESDEEDAAETLVASDDAMVKVIVDNEEHQISVSDLKRLYGQEASLTRKSQDVAQQRKVAEANIEKTHLVLQKLISQAEEQYKPYKDVDMLVASRTMDASDFAQLRKEAQAAEQNLKFLKEEADGYYNDLRNQQQQTLRQQAQEAVKVLQQEIPDWSNSLYNDIRSYAVAQGLPQEQVDMIVDPAVVTLINKARLYDEGKKVANVKKKKPSPAAKKVLRSRKAPATSSDRRVEAQRKARQAMRNSTDLDDIANAILKGWES